MEKYQKRWIIVKQIKIYFYLLNDLANGVETNSTLTKGQFHQHAYAQILWRSIIISSTYVGRTLAHLTDFFVLKMHLTFEFHTLCHAQKK